MVPVYLRDVEFYVDAVGNSDTAEALDGLLRSDPRAYWTILGKIELLKQMEMRKALQGKLVKRPTPDIYVLRVQSGPVSFRLPFFESPCNERKLVLLTHCAHRSLLRGDRYKAMIEAAERRRLDWIRRNCKEKRDASGRTPRTDRTGASGTRRSSS